MLERWLTYLGGSVGFCLLWLCPIDVTLHGFVHALLFTLGSFFLFFSPKTVSNIIQAPLPIVSKGDNLGAWHDGDICLWWVNMLCVAILIGLFLGVDRGECRRKPYSSSRWWGLLSPCLPGRGCLYHPWWWYRLREHWLIYSYYLIY